MRKASDIVTALFRDRFGPGFMETARSSAGLFSSWTKVVTEIWPRPSYEDYSDDDIPAAAVHSRIRELEQGLLHVEADHPGWIQILQTKQKELLVSVQRRYPKLGIRAIAFSLSREPLSSAGQENPANTRVQDMPQEEHTPPEPQNHLPLTVPKSRRSRNPGNDEFYSALKSLEESVKKRNNR